MAIEPKKARKRAVKKNTEPVKSADSIEKVEKAPKVSKKAIPVPLFQAAPATAAPAKKVAKVAKAVLEKPATVTTEVSSDDSDPRNRKRRRRGGRGRRRPGEFVTTSNSDGATGDESSDDENKSISKSIVDAETVIRKRRRRRRSDGDDVAAGEIVEEDGVTTVVKVREARTPVKKEFVKREDRPQRAGEYRAPGRCLQQLPRALHRGAAGERGAHRATAQPEPDAGHRAESAYRLRRCRQHCEEGAQRRHYLAGSRVGAGLADGGTVQAVGKAGGDGVAGLMLNAGRVLALATNPKDRLI